MRVIKLLIIGTALFLISSVNAQVSVNINIGSPPQWGPVGYTDVRYYYLPDIEAYYDVESSVFIYFGDGVWLRRTYLPSRYSNYDLYYGYKVVMTDYHGNTPYIHFNQHKIKYAKGYRGKAQKSIGQKPNNKIKINSTNHGGNKSEKISHKSVEPKQNKNHSGGGHKQKGNSGGNGKKK